MTHLAIRPATIDDTDLILRFVRELAIYEKAEQEALATPAHVHRTQGRHGLYLEDLYVSPEHRGKGAGMALLRQLARIAVDHDCGRFEWSVLDWNTPPIALYDSLGARPQSEWIRYRLTGDELHALAAQSQPLLQPSNPAP